MKKEKAFKVAVFIVGLVVLISLIKRGAFDSPSVQPPQVTTGDITITAKRPSNWISLYQGDTKMEIIPEIQAMDVAYIASYQGQNGSIRTECIPDKNHRLGWTSSYPGLNWAVSVSYQVVPGGKDAVLRYKLVPIN